MPRGRRRDLLSRLKDQYHAIRFKDGGFVWMYDAIRQKIAQRIEAEWNQREFDTTLDFQRAISHQGIADWYAKLFRASNDPLAAAESIYHRLRACIHAANLANSISPSHQVETAVRTRDMDPKHLACTSALEAMLMLKLARSAFLSRGHLDDAEELIAASKEAHNVIEPFDRRHTGRRLVRECIVLVGDLYRRSANFEKAIAFYKSTTRTAYLWMTPRTDTSKRCALWVFEVIRRHLSICGVSSGTCLAASKFTSAIGTSHARTGAESAKGGRKMGHGAYGESRNNSTRHPGDDEVHGTTAS